MTITIKTDAELELLTEAELAAYEQALNAQLERLRSALWSVDVARFGRTAPAASAEPTMPRLTSHAERAALAA